MSYSPKPQSVEDVALSKDLVDLTEILAENAHEVWAKTRINAGWTYGEHRNDKDKKHPGLVPYKQLTESEKEYDRNTAMGTIKLIIKLGYEIKKIRND